MTEIYMVICTNEGRAEVRPITELYASNEIPLLCSNVEFNQAGAEAYAELWNLWWNYGESRRMIYATTRS